MRAVEEAHSITNRLHYIAKGIGNSDPAKWSQVEPQKVSIVQSGQSLTLQQCALAVVSNSLDSLVKQEKNGSNGRSITE